MGKDHWYWGGKSTSNCKRSGRRAETDIPSTGGCMCAFFQAFDFHPFHFSINHHQPQSSLNSSASHTPEDLFHSVPKGAEAPRNSLESEDGNASCISKEENFKIPKNIIRIKTSGTSTRARNLNGDVSSEIISNDSPGTKTPTLVARLMGLDLLPDTLHSSSSSSSSCLSTPKRQANNLKPRQQHIQHFMKHRKSTGSSDNARRSDVEHHRLSLQINKENMVLGEDNFELPRFSFSKRKYDENNNCRSPSHYARQIVKQVKESVSRKVGLDITNTVKNREKDREEFVGQVKLKKSRSHNTSVKSSLDESSFGKHSNPSNYSPRLSRFMDTKHKPSTKTSPIITPKDQNTFPILKQASSPNIEAQISRVITKPKNQALPEQELQEKKAVLPPKCKKSTTNEKKFSSRLNKPPPQASIRNKQEEPFIIRSQSPTRANDIKTKSKRTHPLSTNLLLNNLNTVPNLHPVKTDPSPPAAISPQKQVSDAREPKRFTQLSSCSSQKYKQEATSTLATQGTNSEEKTSYASTITTGAEDEKLEFHYITAILIRIGVHKTTQPQFQLQWFSPTHPLNPSIFHHLELYPPSNFPLSSPRNDKDCTFKQKNQLGPRCNRRLLFDLVDEVLSEILKRPKSCHRGLLLETVWKRVRSFPRAKCEVLEDIDGLIEMEDMQGRKLKEKEEEGEELVAEIEGSILETLVHETVTVMVSGGSIRRERRRFDELGDMKQRVSHGEGVHVIRCPMAMRP